jgi:hypothetical protein
MLEAGTTSAAMMNEAAPINNPPNLAKPLSLSLERSFAECAKAPYT